MSKPRGNSVQRRLVEVARQVFEGSGFTLEVDFDRGGRDGHQRLKITRPKPYGGGTYTMHLSSSPRNEGDELSYMRQRCQRILRGQR